MTALRTATIIVCMFGLYFLGMSCVEYLANHDPYELILNLGIVMCFWIIAMLLIALRYRYLLYREAGLGTHASSEPQDLAPCLVCGGTAPLTRDGRYAPHGTGDGKLCAISMVAYP